MCICCYNLQFWSKSLHIYTRWQLMWTCNVTKINFLSVLSIFLNMGVFPCLYGRHLTFITGEQIGSWVCLKFLCGSTLKYIYVIKHQTVYYCKVGVLILFISLCTFHMNNNISSGQSLYPLFKKTQLHVGYLQAVD